VKLSDLQIIVLWTPSFMAEGKLHAMGKDGKHGLRKLRGSPHEGHILEMTASSKNFHVYQAPLSGLIFRKSYIKRWIPWSGCIEGIQGSALCTLFGIWNLTSLVVFIFRSLGVY
jgi:hypothetical protein